MSFAWRVTCLATAVWLGGIALGRAQDLKLGEIYRGTVQLTKESGGIVLPLPNGEWQLVALEPSRHTRDEANLAAWSGAFVSLELSKQQRLKSFITFYMVASDMFAGGWKVPASCTATNTLHLVRIEARQRRDIRCWGVKSYGMGVTPNSAQWYRDTNDWVVKNTKHVPATLIGVNFTRASGPKLLTAVYLFNPEAAGQARSGWTNSLVQADAKKSRYIESLKNFGERWEPRIDRGFAGKPP